MPRSSWFAKLAGSLESGRLDSVLRSQLPDLYDAELQFCEALPVFAASIESRFRDIFREYFNESEKRVARLSEAFGLLGEQPSREASETMQDLISETSALISSPGDPYAKDVALIAACQRIEHYGIAGYCCARAFAQQLGYEDVALLLQASLDDDVDADRTLASLAEELINVSTKPR